MGERERAVRLRADDRRAEIVGAARRVFLERGYADVGLAELARAGAVSRASIYRYFPAGRPDLFLAVTEDLVADLHERLRYAASAPFSPAKRMEHLLAALFAFFQEDPAAYRFLFRDVWAAREEAIEASAVAARAPLAAEIAAVVAQPDTPPDEIATTSVGILAFALSAVELTLAGQADSEAAWTVTCRFATSQMAGGSA
ncbi:MAG TPA: helix-turn-helix domain-containing protein [Acidimicrobiales bacterium]